MALSEGLLYIPLVYVVENVGAAGDIQVSTESISVTLYFQIIA